MRRILILLVSLSLLAGCSVNKVEAWERQHLARPEMAWDPDAATASYRSHVFFSKEASNGGAGAGGGGCGCN